MSKQKNITIYLFYLGIFVLILVLFVLYGFEITHFNRTFQARQMALWSLVVGISLGLLISLRFIKTAEDVTEKVQIILIFTIGIATFMPLFASLSNRLLSFHDTKAIPVEFVESEAYVSGRFGLIEGENIKPNGYRTYFYRDSKLQRVLTEEPLFPDAERGDTVNLSVKKGLWGIEFVPKVTANFN